jgi:hypothetical protein
MRLILKNPSLEQEITEGKERLAELFDARLEFSYARLQIDDRGLFSLAICLLRDAKLPSTSLDFPESVPTCSVVARDVHTSGAC